MNLDTDATLGSITRRVGARPAPAPVPDYDETMRTNSDFWIGWLAASIHGHLNKKQPRDRLERDYQEFMDSPCCTDDLREILA